MEFLQVYYSIDDVVVVHKHANVIHISHGAYFKQPIAILLLPFLTSR